MGLRAILGCYFDAHVRVYIYRVGPDGPPKLSEVIIHQVCVYHRNVNKLLTRSLPPIVYPDIPIIRYLHRADSVQITRSSDLPARSPRVLGVALAHKRVD